MAWTLIQQFTYTSAPDYKNRIEFGFLKSAQDVISEDPSTPNHVARVALANNVINGEGVPRRAVKILHILNPALQVDGGNPTDNDILFTIAQQWDWFAGQS